MGVWWFGGLEVEREKKVFLRILEVVLRGVGGKVAVLKSDGGEVEASKRFCSSDH